MEVFSSERGSTVMSASNMVSIIKANDSPLVKVAFRASESARERQNTAARRLRQSNSASEKPVLAAAAKATSAEAVFLHWVYTCIQAVEAGKPWPNPPEFET